MSDKLWFKIGEAAAEVGASSQEIRYWEKKIPEIRPRRSGGNIRYYHRDDLPRLLAVRRWTESGFSAADCRAMLLGGQVEHGLGMGAESGGPGDARSGAEKSAGPVPASARPPGLEPIIDALKQVLGRLEGPPGPWRNGA
jgi:DNA-binding transcriptional MerR regulator